MGRKKKAKPQEKLPNLAKISKPIQKRFQFTAYVNLDEEARSEEFNNIGAERFPLDSSLPMGENLTRGIIDTYTYNFIDLCSFFEKERNCRGGKSDWEEYYDWKENKKMLKEAAAGVKSKKQMQRIKKKFSDRWQRQVSGLSKFYQRMHEAGIRRIREQSGLTVEERNQKHVYLNLNLDYRYREFVGSE